MGFDPADFDRVVLGTARDDTFLEPPGTVESILFETLEGNDVVRGGDGDDALLGGAGDDVFLASAGNDRFDGEGGNDTYDATDLGVSLEGRFAFQFGGVIQKGSNLGVDTIGRFELNPDGTIASVTPIEKVLAPIGGHDNLIDLSAQSGDVGVAAASVDLGSGFIKVFDTDAGATFTVQALNFQDITGTNLDDDLVGDAQANEIVGGTGADVIDGRSGNDRLNGGDGDDTLRGGDGDDVLVGSAGNDALIGDAGFDVADYSEFGAPITFAQAGRVFKGDDDGDLGVDQLGRDDPFSFVEAVIGDPNQNNVIDNSGGNNIRVDVDLAAGVVTAIVVEAITGIPGVEDIPAGAEFTVSAINFRDAIGTDRFGDDLFGTDDGNMLIGGGGADDIQGRGGDDILIGGEGKDFVNPGEGFDSILLSDAVATDQIIDFNTFEDAITVFIAGVTSVATQVSDADLDIVVDDGGAFDGALLATLQDRAAFDGQIDLDVITNAFALDSFIA